MVLGLKPEGREHLLPYASLVFNAFGPPNQLRQDAIERSAPHQAYVAAQCQRENLAPGGFGASLFVHNAADGKTVVANVPEGARVRSCPTSSAFARPRIASSQIFASIR